MLFTKQFKRINKQRQILLLGYPAEIDHRFLSASAVCRRKSGIKRIIYDLAFLYNVFRKIRLCVVRLEHKTVRLRIPLLCEIRHISVSAVSCRVKTLGEYHSVRQICGCKQSNIDRRLKKYDDIRVGFVRKIFAQRINLGVVLPHERVACNMIGSFDLQFFTSRTEHAGIRFCEFITQFFRA